MDDAEFEEFDDDIEIEEPLGVEGIALDDAPDIRIPYRDEDFHDGKFDIYWKTNDVGIDITIVADATIHLYEIGGDDGPVWTSPTFRGRKISLKDSILAAIKGEVTRIIHEEWSVRNKPAERKATKVSDTARLRQTVRDREERIRELEQKLGMRDDAPKS